MINKSKFKKIREDLNNFEKKREKVIQTSRSIIKLSKRIIYSVLRKEIKEAEKLIKDIKKQIKTLPKGSYDVRIDHVAYQEYVEAVCFYSYVKNKSLPTRKELNVDTESYLLGLCDMSGELVRLAVNEAIRQNYNSVFEIKDFVEEIYGEFLKFNLRNGELRKKSDAIKWNLRKLEDLALKYSNI